MQPSKPGVAGKDPRTSPPAAAGTGTTGAGKPVHAANVPTPTDATLSRGQLTHDQIARRAEKLWRERRQPSGQDDAIWLEAEAQLKAEAEARPVSGTESRPYVDEPGTPVRRQTKAGDPADAAAQTRSATEGKSRQSAGKLRNQ